MDHVKCKPIAYFRLDDASPFQDYSGYNNSATLTGTESKGLPLVSYATYSQTLSSTQYINLGDIPVYLAGRESLPFTLMASVYINTSDTGVQQIVSHGTDYDGIAIDGTVVIFSTKYSGGVAECRHDVQSSRRVDIVGVHSETKNSLYIDGVLVDEIDIDPALPATGYSFSSPTFYSGRTAGSKKSLINSVAFYSKVLQPEEITALYQFNTKRAEWSVPKMYGGEDVFISSTARQPYLNTGWRTAEEWGEASLHGVVVDNEQLSAQMDEGITQEGVWLDSVDLYAGEDPVEIRCVNMWWDGVNETVEASVDGVTWAVVAKGQNLSVIPQGFDPEDKSLLIRISFPAGEQEAYVDNMTVRGYLEDTIVSNNRVITYTNPAATLDEHHPASMRDDWGVRLSGGTLTIGADLISEIPEDVRTVEMWVKRLTASAPTLSSNLTAGGITNYRNGVGGAGYTEGEWVLRHFVSSTPITGSISIGGNIQIGKIAFYDTALTGGQIASVIANYVGTDTVRYDGTGAIAVTESAAPVAIYAADWEIQSA